MSVIWQKSQKLGWISQMICYIWHVQPRPSSFYNWYIVNLFQPSNGTFICVQVFSFLGHTDLCRAALVCRQWRAASAHEDFWRCLNFENRNISIEQCKISQNVIIAFRITLICKANILPIRVLAKISVSYLYPEILSYRKLIALISIYS